MKGIIFGMLLTCLSLGAMAQPTDSLLLSYADFLGLVLENHPVAQQATLRGQSGEAYVQVARGAFDPYLAGVYDAKQFKEKNYWRVFEGSLRVPTWMGIEAVASYTNATGDYLDPSLSLPSAGQTALGVEWNLGRGLLIDQRRADLRKAQLYAQSTLVEQRLMLLDLVVEASNAYWEWWLAHYNLETFTEALRLAEVRHQAVENSYERGENPAIDTLEAYLQVQNREYNLSEASVELLKASRKLSNFLWNPEGKPVEFSQPMVPQPTDSIALRQLPTWEADLVDSLLAQHPDLVYYSLKAEQLAVEERWRKEQLKPELVLKYQALTAPLPNGDGLGYLSPASNLKWGMKLSMPLFLRKQRGYLALNRIAQQEVAYQQSQKTLEITNKLTALSQQIAATQTQVNLYAVMVDNYWALVKAENDRFELGESSIFLVNSREQKLIEAEVKLNELRAKLPKLLAEANRATGGYLLGTAPQQ